MKLTFLFSIILSTSVFSQKEKYHFNEILTYEVIIGKKKSNEYYLYNSNHNDYFAKIEEPIPNNGFLNVSFIHFNNLYSSSLIKKRRFLKAETLNINCNYSPINRSAKKNNECTLIKIKDSIISNKKLSLFRLANNNVKKTKENKFSSQYFLVDESQKQKTFYLHANLPFLSTAKFPLPPGLVHESYMENPYRNLYKIELKYYKLIDITKQDRYITLNKNCN